MRLVDGGGSAIQSCWIIIGAGLGVVEVGLVSLQELRALVGLRQRCGLACMLSKWFRVSDRGTLPDSAGTPHCH